MNALRTRIRNDRGMRERQFAARMEATTVEVDAGHLAMISHADDVVKLIGEAVTAVGQLAVS